MDNEERAKYRKLFWDMCEERGYPRGVYPGASLRTVQDGGLPPELEEEIGMRVIVPREGKL